MYTYCIHLLKLSYKFKVHCIHVGTWEHAPAVTLPALRIIEKPVNKKSRNI